MSNKKDIGNLNNKDFGVELDPNNNLKLVNDQDKGQKAYYKGKPMKYMDYMQEVSDRIIRNKKGKGADNIGLFAGVNFDKNGRIKTYNSDSESQNLTDFLNDYSEARANIVFDKLHELLQSIKNNTIDNSLKILHIED